MNHKIANIRVKRKVLMARVYAKGGENKIKIDVLHLDTLGVNVLKIGRIISELINIRKEKRENASLRVIVHY